jgi:hypothetical protein
LEWEAFVKNNNPSRNVDDVTMHSFSRADVLIAADVIYDSELIDSLVGVAQSFLSESLSPRKRQAIFAITKRNMRSFQLFLDKVQRYGIDCEWLISDCSTLPRVFECNFTQDRCDVKVACLTIPGCSKS